MRKGTGNKPQTIEQFQERLDAKFGGKVICIGPYLGSNIQTAFKNTECGCDFIATPHNTLQGKGCASCWAKRMSSVRIVPNEVYLEKLKLKHPTIIPLENYVASKVLILHRCLNCKREWKVSPNHLLAGYGCADCTVCGKVKYATGNTDLMFEKLKGIPIKYIGKIRDRAQKRQFQCLVCDHRWEASPLGFVNSKGCPACNRKIHLSMKAKSQEQYNKELFEISDGYIICTEPYIKAGIKIKHKCILCDHEWPITPGSVLRGSYRCQRCSIMSKGEERIHRFLRDRGVVNKYEKTFDDCRHEGLLSFDFHLIDLHTLIEYDGQQHYFPIEMWGGQDGFDKLLIRDAIKTKYCLDKNIPLIRIPYFDFDRIEEILTERFGLNKQ